jgi:pyrroline-5-carboxylate reductase
VSIKGKRVGFIGGGNMGEALIRGLVGANLVKPSLITATDVRAERCTELAERFGVSAHADNARCVRDADVVILAVKPQIMGEVLRDIAPAVEARHLLISIAAGVSTGTIRAGLGKEARIIRVMPNTPALVLQGAAAIAKGRGLERDDLATAEEIFGAVGRVVVLEEGGIRTTLIRAVERATQRSSELGRGPA